MDIYLLTRKAIYIQQSGKRAGYKIVNSKIKFWKKDIGDEKIVSGVISQWTMYDFFFCLFLFSIFL